MANTLSTGLVRKRKRKESNSADVSYDRRCRKEDGDKFASDIVKVLVGPRRHAIYIHQSVIRQRSAFFATALKPAWTSEMTRIIELPEEDQATFQSYVSWLYSGNIPCIIRGHIDDTQGYTALIQLYGLGERMLDDEFQNEVIDSIIAASRHEDENGQRWWPSADCIDDMYCCTPKGSPGRRLMVDMYLSEGTSDWLDEGEAPKTLDFLLDLGRASLEQRGMTEHELREKYRELAVGRACSYHKRGKEKACNEG